MLYDFRIRNLNEFDNEDLFQLCRNSSLIWFSAHGIKVLLISSVVVHLIIHLYGFVYIMRNIYCLDWNILIFDTSNDNDNDEIEDMIEPYSQRFWKFLHGRLELICLYVLAAFLFDVLIIGNRLTTMLVVQWWIEGTIDSVTFLACFYCYLLMLIDTIYYQYHLNEVSRMLFVLKMCHFILFRYANIYSDSKLNTFLVYIFQRLCITSHYWTSNDRSIITSFREFSRLTKDILLLLNENPLLVLK